MKNSPRSRAPTLPTSCGSLPPEGVAAPAARQSRFRGPGWQGMADALCIAPHSALLTSRGSLPPKGAGPPAARLSRFRGRCLKRRASALPASRSSLPLAGFARARIFFYLSFSFPHWGKAGMGASPNPAPINPASSHASSKGEKASGWRSATAIPHPSLSPTGEEARSACLDKVRAYASPEGNGLAWSSPALQGLAPSRRGWLAGSTLVACQHAEPVFDGGQSV
ncbi:MAG: exodeoxyribonuclease Xth [Polaromonas sp.]|nr:exodeoxyribonuclease Xth [Polaromonas sp.]